MPDMPLPVRIPRPFLTTILLYLLAGAFLNWPIAWLCALDPASISRNRAIPILTADSQWPSWVTPDWPPLAEFITRQRLELDQQAGRDDDSREFAMHLSTNFPEFPKDCVVLRTTGLGLSQTIGRAASDTGRRPTMLTYTEYTFGVPFRSILYGDAVSFYANSRSSVDASVPPWRFKLFGHPYALPITPTSLGFALNTPIYALLLWITITTVTTLRTNRRLRRHQCPLCGYQLSPTTTLCPECGPQSSSPSRNAAPE